MKGLQMATIQRGTAEGLTLEISGPQIPADKFEQGIRAFFAIVTDVTRQVHGTGKGLQWTVGVHEGSVCVDFVPHPLRAEASVIPQVLDTVEQGIVAVECGNVPPPHYGEKAVANTAKLAGIVGGAPGGPDLVRVWRNSRAHPLTARAVANADARAGVESRDWGSIEGILQTITEVHGLRFMVHDAVTKRSMQCFFDDEMLDDVMEAFQKRVSVSGTVRYRGNGEPVSIQVEDMHVFPPDGTLPGIYDVLGILRRAD